MKETYVYRGGILTQAELLAAIDCSADLRLMSAQGFTLRLKMPGTDDIFPNVAVWRNGLTILLPLDRLRELVFMTAREDNLALSDDDIAALMPQVFPHAVPVTPASGHTPPLYVTGVNRPPQIFFNTQQERNPYPSFFIADPSSDATPIAVPLHPMGDVGGPELVADMPLGYLNRLTEFIEAALAPQEE